MIFSAYIIVNINLARELGLEPRMTESKSVVLPLHYSRTETGFVSRTRTYDKGPKSRMLGALRVSQSYPHIPSMPYLTFHTIRPVPHFPGSQCLVLKPTRLLPTMCYLLPYLIYSMLLYLPLHYNEINLVDPVGTSPHS
jgi:hypothetical protein